ncbi:MAG TPA: c-type cytochrome [Rhizomicrobium sp.]|jgi:mono/diheme cytochrome c family protein|nr:c-type cytochrome [Rhizomicrobium sp.]
MRGFWTWLKRGVLVLGGVALFSATALGGWVLWRSEAHLRSFPNPPEFRAPIPSGPEAVRRGRHIAQTRGCFACHGDALQGGVFHTGPWGYRAVAANIAWLAKQESPSLLERAIRHGIGHDGRALYDMPSYNFVRLSDADLADLIAFLRAIPARDNDLPKGMLGWTIRWNLATGRDAAIAAFVPKVPQLSFQNHPDPAVRRGEYLAMTSCNECHGFGLRGDNPWDPPGERAPDLVIAASYTWPDFLHFMRTGKAAGNRELPMMSGVARGRFAHWTDREVADLYAFFQALSAKAAK